MAWESSHPQQPKLPSYSKIVSTTDEIESARQPLIGGVSSGGSYSVRAAILPFLFPALGGVLFGYDIGATCGAQISLESPTLSGTTWYDLSSVEIGLVVSGSLYGALIGSILAYNVADFLGRRRELILASVLYFVGALSTSLAPNFALLILGRFFYGIGIGLVMHAAPIYIAETCPRQIRGILVSMKEFFIILGLLLGYTISSIYVDFVAGWRYMYSSSAPVCLIMGIGMWWLPPSPRWLILSATRGKQDVTTIKQLAVSCFCRLRGQATDSSSLAEADSILDELHADLEKQVTIGEIFQGKCLQALIIGAGLVFFQQVTGQPSVLYYAATILQSAGFDAASDATRVSILIGLLKLITTGIAVFVVDKFGRRPMLIAGVSGMAVSLFLLSTYYTLLKDLPYVAVIALLSYVGCYQVSFGPIGWLMISEVFPLRFRGRGLSIAVLVNFTSNALVTFSFSLLQDWVGTASIFAGFGVVATAALVFIYFVVPETKGLTLEEIEAKIL